MGFIDYTSRSRVAGRERQHANSRVRHNVALQQVLEPRGARFRLEGDQAHYRTSRSSNGGFDSTRGGRRRVTNELVHRGCCRDRDSIECVVGQLIQRRLHSTAGRTGSRCRRRVKRNRWRHVGRAVRIKVGQISNHSRAGSRACHDDRLHHLSLALRERIIALGADTQTAVVAFVPRVACAAHDLLLVPERVHGVLRTGNALIERVPGQVFNKLAGAVATAVGRAGHAAAAAACEARVARAEPFVAITRAAVGALGVVVGVVRAGRRVTPGTGVRAHAHRAVSAGPVLHAVAHVARAALTMARALVGAGRERGRDQRGQQQESEAPLAQHRVGSSPAKAESGVLESDCEACGASWHALLPRTVTGAKHQRNGSRQPE